MLNPKIQIKLVWQKCWVPMRLTMMVAVMAVAVLSGSVPAMATGLLGLDIDSGNIYTVSKTNAALTLVAKGVVPNGGCLASVPDNNLYSITVGDSNDLYRIDPNTFVSTLVGPLGLPFVFEGGLAFSPSGTAYATNANSSASPQLFTVNLSTGAATVVGTMPGTHDVNGLLWRSDGMLVGIDDDGNSLVTINPVTAAIATVAPLGTTLGGVGDLTMVDGTAYFSTGGPLGADAGSNQLWTVNLFTGADSLVGSFGSTINDRGIAGLAPGSVPEPVSIGFFGVIGAGLLGRRRRHGNCSEGE